MRIGFSFWGFLGSGIIDTPDGGRFWRRPIVDELIGLGHEVVLLQTDWDRTEAGQALPYRWHAGFPAVDVLMCEWRWPLPGRNTTPCGSVGHTCDLHRQTDLIRSYTNAGVPTLIWDTDRQLPTDASLRQLRNVLVCEPGLAPPPGSVSLPTPVPDRLLDAADPAELSARTRMLALAYVGNQYDRDGDFAAFFAPAAARFPHQVAGKWTQTSRWPWVNFTGRCAFSQTRAVYLTATTTILLNRARYSRVGHVSQRLGEAVLAGCLPLTPTSLACADVYTPSALHVADGAETVERITWAQRIAGSREHEELIEACLLLLEPFRLSAWARRLTQLMTTIPTGSERT
ncbi:hypothetical protein [Actinoallomurus iriomotensis]|uniref:Uncharacterized protein n=1 Tax=Actinoallomurus iriomotensis TaxID=478107 RepID=A0A9W6RNB0_9ACTN|nr:hypothetical protein [Actinoallomurus iriomotensis]GLY78874.1 hypothetical protein Airi01_071410 [Actinoallomurus iriomotensis]